ncbi:hypothetical protein RV06_GL000233 [Enterococcus haemoperoxidus]|nr:hypothetical protein RV06_GL000233 [Enterococcus haemoperoxidus]
MLIYSHHVKEDDTMNYRVEQKAAFTVRGYTKEIAKIENNENFYAISHFWSNLTDEKINQLVSISDGSVQGVLGVSDSNESKKEQFNYTIGTSVNHEESAKNELNDRPFPASSWAIFKCIGAISAGIKAIDENQPFELNNLMQLKQKKYAPWLDESILENTEIPRIEFYPLGDMEAADYLCELWIPIKQ